MMRALEWNVFVFASESVCSEVEQAIARCGHAALCHSGPEWFDLALPAEDLPPIVLFESGWKDAPTVEEILHRRPAGPWIGVFAGHCRNLGAHCLDFVFWPTRTEELKLRLDRMAAARTTEEANCQDHLARSFASFNLVGDSPLFRQVLKRVELIGRVTATTLIEGETGTGKELIARAIHYLGPRRKRAYIPVNCGAIPEGLVESEFLGHERGAFTDAREKRLGVFEQASGGTLFLDEIEALCPKGQVTLLRLLQEQEFRPVGSNATRRTDARVIAASNASLQNLVHDGRFRTDLYYRLNILSISIPPLRDRPEDIEPLACRFLASLRSRYGGVEKPLSKRSLEWMRGYSWPGNVRELENLLHRAYVFSTGTTLEVEENQIHEETREASSRRDFQSEKSRVLDQFEREYLTWVMNTSGGNVTRAAQLAGKERRAMGKLLKKHGIHRSA